MSNIWPRIFPSHGNDSGVDSLWLIFNIYKIDNLSMNPRSPNPVNKADNKPVGTYKILAPNDIQETISHTWDEYSNMAGRMGETGKTFKKSIEESIGLISLKNTKNASLSSILDSATTAGSQNKIDKPLVYTNSNRRDLPLTFQFADQGNGEEDVLKVYNDFRKYSSPSIGDDAVIGMNYPHVFSITSEPYSLIHIPYCVLTSLQPQYYGPYRKGIPSKCDVTMTFKDLQPMYQSTWEGSNKVTTGKI